jgi:hypothetical protein
MGIVSFIAFVPTVALPRARLFFFVAASPSLLELATG